LPNPDGIFRPGMYASVTILLAEVPDVLTLPTTAVMQSAGEPYCLTVDAGTIKKRPVELGLRSGPEVEIKSGLSTEDVVVQIRGESLTAGQAVEVIRPQ
jgi:multidrug efflux pump subunit AcrA (membrane-fusion protein)